jgi:cell division cycle 14
MMAFMIIVMGYTADKAWQVFYPYQSKFTPYRDACMGPCSYRCTIIDCLRGLQYAMELKWYDYNNFNLTEYEHYEQVEHGDMNWIVPGKFMAFSGPSSTTKDPDGYRTFTPDDYVPIFKKFGVTTVVRLNNKMYEASRFTNKGIKHLDMFFKDGTQPPDEIAYQFIELAEKEPGAIAVHCKAGLGRTGSVIANYCMKHYGFPAAAFIGWIRIARPGSILGPQQFYLIEMEKKIIKGPSERMMQALVSKFDDLGLSESKSPQFEESTGGYSPEDRKKMKSGDFQNGVWQGDALAKRKMENA